MVHFRTPLAIAALAALLSACGGGGGGSSPIPANGSGSQPAQPAQKTGPANMTIYIPLPSQQNKHFRPNYISAATQSMTVGLVNGTTTTNLATVNLTQSSPNCMVPSSGGLQCTTTVQAPFGTDTFAVSTYSATNGGGSVLSTGEVQATLTAGGTTPTVQLSLNGVPASVSLALGTATLPVGTAGSTAVIVQALDASNNLIIGPGIFATPISLAVSGDTYSTLALSANSVTSPGQVVTLSYNGGTNIGSTITPSASGLTSATGATFAGSGGSLTLYQYYNSGLSAALWFPEDIAAGPASGTAAAVFDLEDDDCCGYETVATLSPAGVQQMFIGDTTDPFNPGNATPSFWPESGSIPGMTLVHGMSNEIETEEFSGYDDIAYGSNGDIYYSGQFNPENDNTNCEESEEDSGTLGVLNPTAGTTQEYVLKGYPGPIKIDSNGNVWFIEASGTCDESYYYPNGEGQGYAIGELPFGSSSVIQTPFSSTALSTVGYPCDMALSPNGAQMFVVDCDNNVVYKVATANLSSALSAAGLDPEAIATAPDGTTAWFSGQATDGSEGGGDYFYGYVPGTASNFSTGVAQGAFPISGFYSDDMSYADGSFWIAGIQNFGGIGRLSGLAAGAPVAGYYPMPYTNGECDCGISHRAQYNDEYGQELSGIFAGNGYVWAADYEEGNIDVFQYGAPSSGTVTYTSRRIGAFRAQHNAKKTPPGHHAVDPHRRN
jgi:hypothetical protein